MVWAIVALAALYWYTNQ